MPEKKSLRIATRLQLDTPSGVPLDVHEVTGSIWTEGEDLLQVVVTFCIDKKDWPRVDQEQLFNLSPEVRGGQFEGGFRTEHMIEIEAMLDAKSVALASVLTEDMFALGALLYPSGPEEFRSTESWMAMYVKQQDGLVKAGFRTSWADTAL